MITGFPIFFKAARQSSHLYVDGSLIQHAHSRRDHSSMKKMVVLQAKNCSRILC